MNPRRFLKEICALGNSWICQRRTNAKPLAKDGFQRCFAQISYMKFVRFLIALRSEMYALSDRNAIRIRTNFLLEICANNIENQCANHGFAKISNVPYFVHNFLRAESAQISFRNLREFMIYVLFFLYVSHKFPKGNFCAF